MVSPGWWESLDVTVVAGESVDSAFSANESELGVSVSSELLQMASHVDSLLDEVVKVLGESWCLSSDLQNSQDLGAGHTLDLGNSVLISQDDTDLRGSHAFLGQLVDLVLNFITG